MFWVNGEYRDEPQTLDIADRGFLLGDGLFETILVRNGVGAFLDQHMARLWIGLEALKIPAPKLPDLDQIIARLADSCAPGCDGVARFTISRGVSGRGLVFEPTNENYPTMLLTVRPLAKRSTAPMFVKISSFCRPEKSVAARHKTLNYLDNILARNEAAAEGFDEAIMLNGLGRIACASVANVFIIDKHGVISTPPINEGALPGIVREKILEAGSQIGLSVSEAPLEVSDLGRNFVFLTNSLIGLRQASVEEQAKGQGVSSAVETFQRLQSWYDTCLSENVAKKAGNS